MLRNLVEDGFDLESRKSWLETTIGGEWSKETTTGGEWSKETTTGGEWSKETTTSGEWLDLETTTGGVWSDLETTTGDEWSDWKETTTGGEWLETTTEDETRKNRRSYWQSGPICSLYHIWQYFAKEHS